MSLVELVVVVTVIAILVAILVPLTLSTIRASRETRAISNLRAIGSAQMSFYTTNGRFARFEDLFADGHLGQQFRRGHESGGRPGSATEVISDGAYLYSIRFAAEASGITIDADPDPSGARSSRWFRYRLGRVAQGRSGGEGLLLAAPPGTSPPATTAYAPLR